MTTNLGEGFASYLRPLPYGTKDEKDYSKLSAAELIEELKTLPDFDKLVFPNSWYTQFDLPKKECRNMKEFIAESPWMKSHAHSYVGKLEFPPKPGGVRPVLPAPEVPTLTVVQNSFSDAPPNEAELIKNEIIKAKKGMEILQKEQPNTTYGIAKEEVYDADIYCPGQKKTQIPESFFTS